MVGAFLRDSGALELTMTARSSTNGDIVMSRSFVAVVGLALALIGAVAGAGVSWGALNSSVCQHHADKSIHLTSDDVQVLAPSRGEYTETLKRLDENLASINGRLGRIEDRVYGR